MLKLVSSCVLVFTLAGAAAWAQQNPQFGTWKQNLAKSQYNPGPVPKSPTLLKREASGPDGMKLTTDGIDAQGNKTHTEYTAKFDGKDYPLKGSADYDSTAVTRVGSNTTIEVNKKNGNVVRVTYRVVASDGKSYTASQFGAYGKNPPFHNVLVFDKQ